MSLPSANLWIAPTSNMRVRLVRKFANVINGVDLTDICVGDVVDLKPHQAMQLIREGWAEPLNEQASDTDPPEKDG